MTDDRRGGPLSTVLGKIGSSLWPIPVLGVLLAIGLGVLVPAIDGWLDEPNGHPLTFAFGGGASAARDLLAAIAGSLISVTGLTFSLTVIALQLSSSQYSPRLLQTFATDRVVQLTLAQLMLTFVYALTVLRTVRTESATEDETAFVPRLSITVAYVLTLGSVLALVVFLEHLSRVLRVETMLRDVHSEGTRTIHRELGAPEDDQRDDGPDHDPGPPPGPPVVLVARSSGFVVGIAEAAAVRAVRDAGAQLRLAVRIGDSVVEGTPVAHAWPDVPGAPVDTVRLEEVLEEVLQLHFERSPDRDVAYALRKVIDIAVRALSPGINDPTTAVHALSHASALLGVLATRPSDLRLVRDDEGSVRVVVPAWGLPALLQLVLEEPLQFAEGQPAVLRRIAGLLREVAWRARGRGVDEPLRHYVAKVAAIAGETTDVGEDETRGWRHLVDLALAGSWPPPP
ncbi:DUF2254 domain-containing protein [Modestobacter italicus]|uniref:DUF2254 domain-containing protein n=1 Tax=Modestobacter italicus (strain DSM 44449 / CECT 9708 / BC 501) TaxID=2732864 RepID=UPI001C9887E4|nr:DUF2254 domain-containing protein [Modestobacter italicus]